MGDIRCTGCTEGGYHTEHCTYVPKMAMRKFETDEELKARGLKRVIKYVVVMWDERGGWHSCLTDDEGDAKGHGGYGDFAGYGKVTCIVPIDA